MRFLFWNINKKPLQTLVADAAREYNADVVVLAELADDPRVFCDLLNHEYPGFHPASPNLCERVKVFFRFDPAKSETIYESRWVTAHNLWLDPLRPLNLVGVHLPSKLWTTLGDQVFDCVDLRDTIEEVEFRALHARTLVVGDFNMNPFEDGMVAARGLHATMNRASATGRIVRRRFHRSFYNPMWSKFGDLTPGPSGTHYWRGDHVSFDWNMFDQVLLRPSLAEKLVQEKIKIVDYIAGVSLHDGTGAPDGRRYSDHFPIVFEVD
ncbi:MAG: endonuclease/exonuclease/phosphatase family protein [Acidobacteria bacterium]|nr:endonuclease/exonuclease/phosphatase family protein [Acidobacteriota bacterium]